MRVLFIVVLSLVCGVWASSTDSRLGSTDRRSEAVRDEAVDLSPRWGDCPLVLVARVEQERIPVYGTEVVVYAEIHNVGFLPVAVYMPGIKAWLEESYEHRAEMPIDGYGPGRGISARGVAAEPRDNFVVLNGGDFWGRRFSLRPFDTGSAEWFCEYENECAVTETGVPAWVGKLTAKSERTEIYCDAETLNRILDAVRYEGDPYRRVMAIRLLYPRKEPKAVPALLDAMLSGSDPRVTEEAAYALRHISGEKLGVPDASNRFDAAVDVPKIAKWAQSYIDSHPELRGPLRVPLAPAAPRPR